MLSVFERFKTKSFKEIKVAKANNRTKNNDVIIVCSGLTLSKLNLYHCKSTSNVINNSSIKFVQCVNISRIKTQEGKSAKQN